jgi:threonine dehydratase
MAAASTATAASHSASFPAASLRHDARRPSCVAPAAAAATTAAETGLTAVPAPPPTPMLRVVPESLQRDSGCLVAGFRERGAGAADGEGFGDAVGEGGGPGAMEYLTSVLSSKVYDVAIESPLQLATKLSDRLGVNLWIKREDLQPVIDNVAQPIVSLRRHLFLVMDLDICVLLFQKKTAPFLGDAGVSMFQLLLVLVG